MAQRAIAVFLAVGLHSGDAAVPAVAYEVRSWYNPQDCSGPPDDVRRSVRFHRRQFFIDEQGSSAV